MSDTLGSLIKKTAWQNILNSLLPGGDNWHAKYEKGQIDCLPSCPANCISGGPRKMCTKDWRTAEAIPLVLDTLFHAVNNFDHYNVGDLPKLTRHSSKVTKLAEYINRAITASETGFAEGDVKFRMHRYRERNSTEARNFRLRRFERKITECEGCGRDYILLFGDVARSLYQCHHDIPIASEEHGGKTKVTDLRLLCANCHELIHTKKIGLDLNKLKKITRRIK